MDYYTVVSILTLLGFAALACLLLIPVYLFLKREEQASERWTRDALARRLRDRESANNGKPDAEEGDAT